MVICLKFHFISTCGQSVWSYASLIDTLAINCIIRLFDIIFFGYDDDDDDDDDDALCGHTQVFIHYKLLYICYVFHAFYCSLISFITGAIVTLSKISPLSFHTCTERVIAYGPALPTPEPADVSTRQYLQCVSGTLSPA